ncbi:ADP-ribosylglycohydrolase family protein [Paenibacillus jiagnxiensis]|uniref:ADP-ribosylglycohydrolase family protein n=1 Tax=Paenibacillus jiagnxiensis TaxID=3228926 RepID=UPI0033A6B03C
MVAYHADYIERVYAGWLGKVIGVRHGANIENWTYERIERAFGEITDYLYDFKNFAADDDINGPLFFMNTLADLPLNQKVTAEDMGRVWLNYIADGHGFFWWGGYGISTEHTAYLNLKHGMTAPQSGSQEQNSQAVAEQIGGQIFSDIWGFLAPGDTEAAADLAEKMSSVSHDRNGIYGGRFVAACCAAAFESSSVKEVIQRALTAIPEDSSYSEVVKDIIRFHNEHPQDWRACLRYIQSHYGYDRYPGICHIIPNTAVVVLGLLYGEGDFSDSINITNMCGWDTDCNVGNVGAIVGVLTGLTGIGEQWTTPINDFVCASSVVGSRNIQDIASVAQQTAAISKRYFLGQELPDEPGVHAHFDFELPGSTHAFRNHYPQALPVTMVCKNTDRIAFSGKRSLQVTISSLVGGESYRTYLKTYYTPADFNDSRYDPSFTPVFYPGQSISMSVYISQGDEEQVAARLYVHNLQDGTRVYGERTVLPIEQWTTLTWKVPSIPGAVLSEVGVEWIPLAEIFGQPKSLTAYIDDVQLWGEPEIDISFASEKLEVWPTLRQEVRQLTHLRGLWTLENGLLTGSGAGESAEAYTGAHYFRDYTYAAAIRPVIGSSHGVLFRVQGAARSYAVVLKQGHLALLKKEGMNWRTLQEAPFMWRHGTDYRISIVAAGNHYSISVDGELLMDYIDHENPYMSGQVGFVTMDSSRTAYTDYHIHPNKR